MRLTLFERYLVCWQLSPDGDPITTPSSRLLPVRQGNVSAMLKIALVEEEKTGGLFLLWREGQGAARVLAHENGVFLLERAEGARSLSEMARNGKDEEATHILCDTVARLHAPRDRPLPVAVSLKEWFRDLEPAAAKWGGVFRTAATTARELLAAPQEEVVLHGDIHHGNVLDFGERGWLAIDPKCLYGERGFDYANLFHNPDWETATVLGRLARHVTLVAEEANLERKRLLQWIVAWSGLSAAWMLLEDPDANKELTVAEIAIAELNRA